MNERQAASGSDGEEPDAARTPDEDKGFELPPPPAPGALWTSPPAGGRASVPGSSTGSAADRFSGSADSPASRFSGSADSPADRFSGSTRPISAMPSAGAARASVPGALSVDDAGLRALTWPTGGSKIYGGTADDAAPVPHLSRPDRPEPTPDQPDPGRPDPDQPDPGQPQPGRPEPDQPEPERPEPGRPEPEQPRPGQPRPGEPAKPAEPFKPFDPPAPVEPPPGPFPGPTPHPSPSPDPGPGPVPPGPGPSPVPPGPGPSPVPPGPGPSPVPPGPGPSPVPGPPQPIFPAPPTMSSPAGLPAYTMPPVSPQPPTGAAPYETKAPSRQHAQAEQSPQRTQSEPSRQPAQGEPSYARAEPSWQHAQSEPSRRHTQAEPSRPHAQGDHLQSDQTIVATPPPGWNQPSGTPYGVGSPGAVRQPFGGPAAQVSTPPARHTTYGQSSTTEPAQQRGEGTVYGAQNPADMTMPVTMNAIDNSGSLTGHILAQGWDRGEDTGRRSNIKVGIAMVVVLLFLVGMSLLFLFTAGDAFTDMVNGVFNKE